MAGPKSWSVEGLISMNCGLLKNPLDCEEIKSVYPKGNQPINHVTQKLSDLMDQ